MTSSKTIAHKARVAVAVKSSPVFFDLNQEEEDGALSTEKVRLFPLIPPAPLSNEEEATSGTDDASSSQQLAPLADAEEETEVILLVQDGYTENASPSNSSQIMVKRPAKRTTLKPATPAKRPPTTQPDSGCPIRALKRQRLTNAYKGHQPVVDKSSLPSGAIQPKSRLSAKFFEEVYLVDVQSRRKLMHRPMRDVTAWGDVAVVHSTCNSIYSVLSSRLPSDFVSLVYLAPPAS
ncbi:hypothetical protein B0H13DRAFT_1857372 [Mycena leptocephala]|nr:hypothetical protein B0H13DRAFT_1857372 [Mycena leptocephala]